MIENRNVLAFAHAWSAAVPMQRIQTIGSLTTVAFDIFLAETFVPLICGMQVALASESDIATPDAVLNSSHALTVTSCRQRRHG